MSSFYLTSNSNSIELADGSRTPIQDIATVATTPILPLSFVFYLSHFSYNLLSVSKIINVLNYTVIFFFNVLCISGAWDREDDWHRSEQNKPYEIELIPNQVSCISTSSAFDYHCQLGHPSLLILKLLVPSLDKVSSLECESCQLE